MLVVKAAVKAVVKQQQSSSNAVVKQHLNLRANFEFVHFSLPLHHQHLLLLLLPASVSIRQNPSAYVSIRQHTSTYVSIRQHRSA
jgi:hypothetical protein